MSVDPPPLPPVTTLAQAWRDRRDFVDRARSGGGPRTSMAALISLGASLDRIYLYCEVVGKAQGLDEDEGPSDALHHVASMAEIAVEDEGGPDDWGRTTVDDTLAWWTVMLQLPERRPDGAGSDASYWGSKATRHGWAIAAAGVSAADLAGQDLPVTYEQLALMAALRGVRIPALAPGEVFEPPSGVYLEPVQQVFLFDGGGWWVKVRRLVGDPLIGPTWPGRGPVRR